MGMIRKRYSHSHSHPFLFLLTVLWFLPMSDADNTSLVYKGCADEKLQDPSGIYSENLQSLLDSLVSQSGKKAFSTTTSGEGQNVMMGLYQCRGDLSNADCYNCVSKIPDMLDKLCGKVVAARIHLIGCYLRYEVVGFKQVPETQLLYKVCGAKKESYDDGFEERRDSAFGMVESGVKNGGNLFYTGSYQSLYVLGQCEGDLAKDDCGDCVKSAEDQAKAECGDSVSAQIYLHKCFISYSFYSKMSSSPGSLKQQDTQKTIALAVGGVAALGFLIVCLLFLKSVLKKRSDVFEMGESFLWREWRK
ncbi:Cysteine-rich repeat secretory protein 56, partial [Mucuna pruriens]